MTIPKKRNTVPEKGRQLSWCKFLDIFPKVVGQGLRYWGGEAKSLWEGRDAFNVLSPGENLGYVIIGELPYKSSLTYFDYGREVTTFCTQNSRPLGLVISVIEHHETKQNGSFLWRSAIDSNGWSKYSRDIISKSISMPDHGVADNFEEVLSGIFLAYGQLKQGNSVLIHCLMGKGRSPMVAIALLVVCAKYTLEQAKELVVEARDLKGVSEHRINFLVSLIENVTAQYPELAQQIDPSWKPKTYAKLRPEFEHLKGLAFHVSEPCRSFDAPVEMVKMSCSG